MPDGSAVPSPLSLAMGAPGQWNIDIVAPRPRAHSARCTISSSSYYEIWLRGMITLMKENSLIAAEEIESGKPSAPAQGNLRILKGDMVQGVLAKGGPSSRPSPAPALYKPRRQGPYTEHSSNRPYPPAPLCPGPRG